MGKTRDISRYVCDRCAKEVYATDRDPLVSEWREISRVTADSVQTERLLCPECAKEYRALAGRQDAEFAGFMRRE